ncbi:MAG: plastocyanin/azurin family copper-binding protein [Spirosomataceae bacterium]
MYISKKIAIGVIGLLLFNKVQAQQTVANEEDYYKIITVPIPAGIDLEVGGLAPLPDGRLAVSTRKGDVWMIHNPYMFGQSQPTFQRFAKGLHEPLGLAYIDGKIWATQRGEVTILHDINQDGVADEYESFYKWPLSGNYHQYSYGPVPLKDGSMIFTLNLDWIGKGASLSKWRGWMLNIDKKGNMTPFATGLRSPAGFGTNKAGDIFYAENQGDWVGSGRVTHLEKGDFAGNPSGLLWSKEKDSPVKLTPQDIPDTGETLYDVAKRVPGIKPPAVWFPHTLMGISTSDILEDSTQSFGPFAGQLFVGDQGHSKIMRMFLEKVDGVYQGACFPFREGFQSGILRMRWGVDGSMFVGMTSRGWASTGKDNFGLQRLVYTGKMPFEIQKIESVADGFMLTFTQEVDRKSAEDPSSYALNRFNYKYHHYYGSPIINAKTLEIKGIRVSDDGKSVHLSLDSLKLGDIYEIKAEGLENKDAMPLLHSTGYFTLNAINTAKKGLDLTKYAVQKPMAMDEHAHHAMSTETAGTEVVSAKRQNQMPETWNGKPDMIIKLGTKPGLKFNASKIQIKAGSKVQLIFNNNDDMLHNLLLVEPNAVDKVGQAAFELGLEGEQKAYVPDLPEVLFHTGLLQPETRETIYFEAPKKKGNYTLVCTFPGHYTLMQATLVVK